MASSKSIYVADTFSPSRARSTNLHHCRALARIRTSNRYCERRGPWQGNRRSAVEALKPEYRLALASYGYALVKCEHAVFNPEA